MNVFRCSISEGNSVKNDYICYLEEKPQISSVKPQDLKCTVLNMPALCLLSDLLPMLADAKLHKPTTLLMNLL